MTIVKKIAKNTGSLLLGRVCTKIITLFIVIYMVRYLGDADYGKYAFAFAFISFFTIISDLGTHSILVREIARSPNIAQKILGNAILISIILSIISFVLAVLAIYIIDYPIETKQIIFIAATGLFLHAMLPFGVMYEVRLEMQYSVVFGLANRIFLLIAVLAIVFYDLGLSLLVAATVAAEFIHTVLMVIISKRFIWPKFDFDIDLCKFILRESFPLAIASVFIIIYFRIDVVMLSMMKGDAAVGIYSAAYRLTEAFLFIPSTFMVSMFPLMSKYFKESKETLAFAYKKSFKYLFCIALPLAVGITFFADTIIFVIYGTDFQESINVLRLLIWAIAIIFINYSLGQLLVSVNKQKLITVSTAFCALLNIVLNVILIPSFSYQGAAISTVLTEFASVCIMFYYLPHYISRLNLLSEIIVPTIATGFMLIFLLLADNTLPDFLKITLSIIIYLLFIWLLKGIDKDDKKLLSKLKKS